MRTQTFRVRALAKEKISRQQVAEAFRRLANMLDLPENSDPNGPHYMDAELDFELNGFAQGVELDILLRQSLK